jgi:hypothetical protein
MIEKYRALGERGEEMIVRLITAEVEGDLKKHLQRYVFFSTLHVRKQTSNEEGS